MDDVILLSRLQFAVAVFFHFIFVPLTLGLSLLIALMETRYVRTGDEVWRKHAKFWGKLFIINFTLGVVTGITLEFQFGTNWARYSEYVGDIFGSLLAIEATVAFFLESTFLAVWHFGWHRVGKKTHLLAIWLVVLAGNLSALWIILANGFMQNPLGYVIQNGRAELADFMAVVTNPYAWGMYAHTLLSAWTLSCFFVLGVSSWHLLRKSNVEFFRRSFRMTAPICLVLVLALRVLFGVLLLSHGIAKVDDFAALSEVFPDPLGLGSRISLTLAIFGELFCSVGFIVGAFYRLALIPMIFTMCVALFVVHGNDPFAVKELAAIYLSVFVLMYISGPGNYALDRLIAERLRN